jgi:hypothetical protein
MVIKKNLEYALTLIKLKYTTHQGQLILPASSVPSMAGVGMDLHN